MSAAVKKMKETRVCVIGLRGMPDVMGGVETHCEELYPRLKSLAGDEMKITVLGRSPYMSGPTTYLGVAVEPVYAPKNKYFETIVHTGLAVILSKLKYKADIVHIHAIGPSIMVPLAKLLGMRVVVTHHGEDYMREKWNFFAKSVLRTGENMARRLTDRMIVITKSIDGRLKGMPGTRAERLRIIPNGVVQRAALEAAIDDRNEFGLKKNKYIIAVGRLVPEKGFRELVAAFKSVRDRLPDYKLLIVGGADHGDAYSDALTSETDDSVIFAGRQPRERVFDLLSNASLFVLPSHHEGLPIAALEALSCGTPLLLSDISGNKELELPPKHYFPVGDIGELANALLVEHSVYVPNSHLLEKFNWDRIAEATLSVYRELTGVSGSSVSHAAKQELAADIR